MTMLINLVRCARARAHFYGADAVILDNQADKLAAGPLPATIHDCSENQLRALLIATQAHKARQRYFRELEAINILLGHDTVHFAGLV